MERETEAIDEEKWWKVKDKTLSQQYYPCNFSWTGFEQNLNSSSYHMLTF